MWAQDCAKQSVGAGAHTETKIYPGLSHFELESSQYDAALADLAADFAARNRIWDDTAAASTGTATAAAAGAAAASTDKGSSR